MKITENTITRKYTNSVVFELENDIVIFMADYSPDEIRTAMTEFNSKIVSLLPEKYQSYFGVGECTKNIKCISKSYNKAKNAIKLQKLMGKANTLSFYGDLGIYKLLFNVQDKNVIHAYYDELLSPLEHYDSVNGTDYMDFLQLYFENNCNVQETSEKLFMHRNSVRYKLNKIEELLGIDLSSIKNRIDIGVALIISGIL